MVSDTRVGHTVTYTGWTHRGTLPEMVAVDQWTEVGL